MNNLDQPQNNLGVPENPLSSPPTILKKRSSLQVTSSKFFLRAATEPSISQESLMSLLESTDITHSSLKTSTLSGANPSSITEHLDLSTFKTKLCPQTFQHNHKQCPFYHNLKDRKRFGFVFSSEICEFAEKDPLLCQLGDNCLKAHNRVEQLYRPEKYKTKFCTFYPSNLEKCEYGDYCSFAHSETDIVIELIHNYEYDDDFYMFHFKTTWCPFNLAQHDKALCVYAHNWQDYRRRPNQHTYDPLPCPNWKATDFILNYEDGCPFGEKCQKCHGWKENEYHPFNYRVRSCSSGTNCAKGSDCPHYHCLNEKRFVTQTVSSRVFKLVPRNRIVTNTFKIRSDQRGPWPQPNSSISSSGSYQSFAQLISENLDSQAKCQKLFERTPSVENFGLSITNLENFKQIIPFPILEKRKSSIEDNLEEKTLATVLKKKSVEDEKIESDQLFKEIISYPILESDSIFESEDKRDPNPE